MNDIFRIAIVGGGTAGWLTAAYLQNTLAQTINRDPVLTLIESSDIPTIGVGEATIPSLRKTLRECGIEEHHFMKACDATFKCAIQFVNWTRSQADDPGEAYFHPFGNPLSVAGQDPTWQWTQLPVSERGAYAELFSVNPELARLGRVPKGPSGPQYEGPLAYAYHLDAGLLAEFLKHRCRRRGVTHKIDTVAEVKRSGDDITSLILESGEHIEADLYIDCTGFAARLLNSDKENRFHDRSNSLFVDRAVTTRLPHNGIEDIRGFTRVEAQQAGWIWDIDLRTRRGVGHVYSSRHMDQAAAKSALARHVGLPEDRLETRDLSFRVGYYDQQWRGNCLAVGLASGFIEPLESTGIFMIEMANWTMTQLIPRFLAGARPQGRYSDIIRGHYENIIDFVKMHYCLTHRQDTAFWRDNCAPDTIPDTLQANLESWKAAVPGVFDFDRSVQCFAADNYKYVLYGMGWPGHTQTTPSCQAAARRMMQNTQKVRAGFRDAVLTRTMTRQECYSFLDTVTVHP